MRAKLAQYTNEIVSLTIMALMSIALIAGQAGATQHADSEAHDAVRVVLIDADVSFRQEGE